MLITVLPDQLVFQGLSCSLASRDSAIFLLAWSVFQCADALRFRTELTTPSTLQLLFFSPTLAWKSGSASPLIHSIVYIAPYPHIQHKLTLDPPPCSPIWARVLPQGVSTCMCILTDSSDGSDLDFDLWKQIFFGYQQTSPLCLAEYKVWGTSPGPREDSATFLHLVEWTYLDGGFGGKEAWPVQMGNPVLTQNCDQNTLNSNCWYGNPVSPSHRNKITQEKTFCFNCLCKTSTIVLFLTKARPHCHSHHNRLCVWEACRHTLPLMRPKPRKNEPTPTSWLFFFVSQWSWLMQDHFVQFT